ncbi:MAG: uracil-DNA glycosylase [Aliivibrio sp.]|uniref:uracil-DNA glycosylase n=1 Tax=Aliivibrio sp. TaxID=1872443 RepID=UPI001A509322|nr:uracil-DNA glycosylase [Aliivibrio sp.]
MPSNHSLSWVDVIGPQQELAYFKSMMVRVKEERDSGKVIYPANEDVFNAFRYTALADIKVVILGQDPYHGPDQAHGLSFSVLPNVKVPPSLRNIYKELDSDIDGFDIPHHGYLKSWADQGVLLLNTVFTVEKGQAHSHAKLGWETYSEHIISVINEHCDGVIFMLWGAHAQKKGAVIDPDKHYLLKASHPSPLSAHRGFLGCKHFSQANKLLKKQKLSQINWQPDITA